MSLENFYKDFDNIISKIIIERDRISGTHPINIEKAKLWVNSQINNRRKNAARNLINNTQYITFNHIFENTRDVVIELYEKLDTTKKILLFINNKKSSFYFMGTIAVYFIKLLGYKEPEIFISPEKLINNGENCQLVIFDDIIYSGGQMNLYARWFNKNTKCNIFACPIIITEEGLSLLYENDFLNIIHGNVITDLKNILSYEDYFDINYYFNSENTTTNVSMYLDYKVADDVSTFKNVFLFGIIPPKEIGLEENYNWYLSIENTKKHKIYLLNLIKYEQNNTLYKEEKIQFLPFINGCTELRNDLDYEKLSGIPYKYFMTGYTSEEFKNIPEKYKNILGKCYDKNKRCPHAFYKDL